MQLVSDPDGAHVIAGSGVAQVAGSPHLSSFLLPGGVFGPETTLIDLMNATGSELELIGVGNLAGSFTAAGGTMGLSGLSRLCLLFGPCDLVNMPLPIAAAGTPLAGMGIGGVQTVTGVVDVTVQHSGWAVAAPPMTIHYPNTTVVTPSFPAGFVHGPATGSASSAAQPGGVVQFVAATKVYTSLTSAFPEFPMHAVLNLHFVPEPGALALLAAGALAVLGAARSRR